jgi:hypothetical protein
VLIVPDDCLNRALFDTLISDEGGEARANELSLIKTYEKERESSESPSLFSVGGVTGADFDDSEGIRAAAALRPDVDAVMNAVPELLSVMSHAQLAMRLVSSGLMIGHRMEVSVNTGDIAADLKKDINRLAKDETMRRLRHAGIAYSGAAYRSVITDVWREAYVVVGVPWLEFDTIVEIETLKLIRLGFERLLQSQP